MPFSHSDDLLQEAPSIAPGPGDGMVEYIVRPDGDAFRRDSWRIEHAGESYGPYKSCREATFFAIDAARKLGARAGKHTRVRAFDEAGHLLTTWRCQTPLP